MNAREMADLAALVDRIDELLNQFVKETSPERLAVLRAELVEATDKLKRLALQLSKLIQAGAASDCAPAWKAHPDVRYEKGVMTAWATSAPFALALVLAGALYVRLRWRRSPQAYKAM